MCNCDKLNGELVWTNVKPASTNFDIDIFDFLANGEKKSPCKTLEELGPPPTTKFNKYQNDLADYDEVYGIYRTMEKYDLTYKAAWDLIRPVKEERNRIDVYWINRGGLDDKCAAEKAAAASQEKKTAATVQTSVTSSQTPKISATVNDNRTQNAGLDFGTVGLIAAVGLAAAFWGFSGDEEPKERQSPSRKKKRKLKT